MANRFRQFRLLLWKNFVLQLRRPVGTALELILPVVLLAVLILPKVLRDTNNLCFSTFKPLSSKDVQKNLYEGLLTKSDKERLAKSLAGTNGSTSLGIDSVLLMAQFAKLSQNKTYLAYYPPIPPVTKLMERVQSQASLIKLAPRSIFLNRNNWSSADEMADEASQHAEYMGAVHFAISESATTLPKQMKYSLRLAHEVAGSGKRWRTENTYPGFQSVGPRTGLVTKLMERVQSQASLIKLAPRSPFLERNWSSADEMADEASQNDAYMGAVHFAISESATKLPKQMKYSLRLAHEVAGSAKRWRTENTYPGFQSVGPRTGGCCEGYRTRFVLLQYMIDMAIIMEQSNVTQPIPLNLQQFPYPDYTENIFIQTVQGLMPLLWTLAFMFSAVMIIKELVHEKHNRLKESMKMMGLANWIHWCAWFTKSFLFLLISIIMATILFKVAKIFEFSDGSLLFVFLLLYVVASITFCFAISVFFSRPVVAMLFGAVVWFCSLVPFLQINQQEVYETLSSSPKSLSVYCRPTVGQLSAGSAKFESNEVGLTWDKASFSPSADDDFSFSWVLGMFVIQSLFYAVITWYVEAVFPGSYGIPKPFYFPFTKSYWCGLSHDNIMQVKCEEEMGPVDGENNPDIEDETHDLPVGVSIKNLSKVFKGSTGSKVAVDGLSLQMYKGQITALLGHNGAGKTTTMSILTGLFPPSSGSAHVNGKSILTDMESIRESLGLCPQHNVLFDRLTVKEHLEFFINLKGTFGEQAKSEVLQMIADIQLMDKVNWASCKLSGGMKRKLSCAIALIGGSQIVFLDEPTSGMDPYARRGTWDLLLKHKAGRTIILTTHFMDEADFLGDRIAIMADGQLRCCGSSLFLKSRYGVGYHLTLVKNEGCNQNAVTSLIISHVPNAQLLSSVGAEMEFLLSGEHSSGFERLFQEIEDKMEEFGLTSFGVSITTLEEVFIKVGEGSEKTVDDLIHDHEVSGREGEEIVNAADVEQMDEGGLQTGLSLRWQQYKAMFIKRFLNSKRDKKAIVTQLILPLLMVLFGLLLISSIPTRENDPPRVLKLSNLSVDEVHTRAFYADFRGKSSDAKQQTLEKAKAYLSSVKVDTVNITSQVYNIRNGNNGSDILVRDKNYRISQDNDSTYCCNYEFFVLNAKCKSIFIKGELKPKDCKNDNFGYKNCPKCINVTETGTKIDDSTICSAEGCPGTELKNLNTYFSEYVLEDSNASNYFNVYVAGFLFAPEVPMTLNLTTNSTNSSTDWRGPGNKDEKTITTVWYSNEAFHTIAEALSAMSNILLADATGDSFYQIEITNHPLPNSIENKSNNVAGNFSALLLAIFLALGMAFMAASFITFIVQERVSKAKHLQFVSGVDAFSYWFATYTWDFVNYLIPALLIIILFAAFQVESFQDELGVVFLMLVLFGLCVLPFTYCLSFAFTSPLIAYAVTVFKLSIVSMGMLITVFVLQLPSLESEKEAEICHYIFMVLPTYTLAYSLIDLNTNYATRKLCTESAVQKVYGGTNVTAVDHLCLGIPRGECFGLLGINGAGKTTTFSMLTGDLSITKGTAYLDGFNIQTHLRQVQQRIGYCPQFDALIERLTGREMLTMYANLRGVQPEKIDNLVSATIKHLNLAKWADKLCGDYSGGNKRKLSTAIALVGNPPIVFLDEPTTGMDPVARRFLWDSLMTVMKGGRSIVLTSHSMEECEALCTRLAIMVNGQFKCLGSTQHLKSRFGKGYTLMIKVASPVPMVPQQVVNGQQSAPPTTASAGGLPLVYSNSAVTGDLPQVNEPERPLNDGVSSKDVQPAVVQPPPYSETQAPPAQFAPMMYDGRFMEAITNAQNFVIQTFPGSRLLENHNGVLHFQIESDGLKWSYIFGMLERNKAALNIVDYSVSQTALEQVFINFAKEQHSEERTSVKRRCGCFSC
ncbi:PREDICTED: ATP-binding cassette sub-family A member 3-like [Acropora digitifera]|uniref:ATP-binding cassette sub-family A member 3-like n=1 Tax=Acropora digitifera TaxID=70779 RepID=UPI00077A41C3|nr:PREDICTED: ATP-binding cassette sub-family A member 3-like [Acropora digitifera]